LIRLVKSSIVCLSFYIYLNFYMLFLSLASFNPVSSKPRIYIFLFASFNLSLSIFIYVFFSPNCLSYFLRISSNSPFFKWDYFELILISSSSYLILNLSTLFSSWSVSFSLSSILLFPLNYSTCLYNLSILSYF